MADPSTCGVLLTAELDAIRGGHVPPPSTMIRAAGASGSALVEALALLQQAQAFGTEPKVRARTRARMFA